MKKRSYKYIFFDLDGTLVDSGEGITGSAAYALRHFGIEPASREELTRFIGPPLIDSFMRFYGFSEEQAGEAVDLYRSRYRARGVHENVLYPGIKELLSALKERGFVCVLATSKPEVFADIVLEDMGIAEFFDLAAGAELDDAEGRKRKLRSKKEDVIAYAMETLAIEDRSEVLMVGDRSHDIVGARLNGIDSVGVLYGYGSKAELEEAGADYLAETPQAISELLE